ncbi:MAG: terpene synthase family protein [Myxococcota bacterium]
MERKRQPPRVRMMLPNRRVFELRANSAPTIAPPENATGASLELVCPFPTTCHPTVQALHESTCRWAARVHPEAGNVDQRFTWLSAQMVPAAERVLAELLADFTSWLFWHDDMCDEGPLSANPVELRRALDQELLILQGGPARPDLPLERALHDLRARFVQLSPDPSWMVRFVADMADYFDGCVWEAENRSDGRVPRLSEYVPARRSVGAIWVYLGFIELTLHTSMPLAMRRNSECLLVRQLACDVVAWHNDLFSLRKEEALGDVHNITTIVMREYGLQKPDAARFVVARSNAAIYEIQALLSRMDLPLRADAYFRRFSEALKVFIRGAADWAAKTSRYADESPNATESAALSE